MSTTGKSFFVKFWVGMVTFLLMAALFGFFASKAGAEELKKPAVFADSEDGRVACEAALASGKYSHYESTHFGLKSKNPVNDKDRVKLKLEFDQCRHELVVGGWRWVIEKKGTEKRAYKAADGSTTIYARHDCGNPDDTDTLVASKVPTAPTPMVAQAPPTPAPVVVPPAPPVSASPSVAPQPVVVHNDPCVNSLEVLDKLRAKSKKKDATVTCTPDGGVRVTWEEHKKSGPGFWSGFWNTPMGVPVYGNVGGGGGQVYGHQPQNIVGSTLQPIRPYVAGGVLPSCGGGCGNPAVRGGAN